MLYEKPHHFISETWSCKALFGIPRGGRGAWNQSLMDTNRLLYTSFHMYIILRFEIKIISCKQAQISHQIFIFYWGVFIDSIFHI